MVEVAEPEVTMQIELNEQEREEMVKLLKVAHGDLASEIHHAMDHETREELRQRRMLLEGLMNRLNAS